MLAALVVLSWYGAGALLVRALRAPREAARAPLALEVAERVAIGAGLWSLAWLLLGLANLYRRPVALGALIFGLALAALARRRPSPRTAPVEAWPRSPVPALVGLVVALAFIAALAPPTGKDALLYHLAVPKAWVHAGGGIVVPGNPASFYPLGAQVQSVWTLLLGGADGRFIGEAAAMATLFAWVPLLLAIVNGWARERELAAAWAWLATLIVAAIPAVYHVAASGYVDLALAAYVALVMRAAGRWWTTGDAAWLVRLALALGFALAIKPTTVFVAVPLAVVLGFGAGCRPAARTLFAGAATLAGAAALASPWYLRNWVRTGNPVYPFAVDLLGGAAPGWDAERARLYEAFFGLWGGADRGVTDQVLAPLWIAVIARLEDPTLYDGVLGVALLAGLPLVVAAVGRRRLDAEVVIAMALSATMFVGWLHASQQLRYLLPAVPGWALAVVASASALRAGPASGPLVRRALAAAAATGVLVTVTWFLEAHPLRAVLGGEPRGTYLARRLDYYPYYEIVNRDLPASARVWLINLRRDSYHLERPYFSDFIFEDWTLRQWVRAASGAGDLRARATTAGFTHVLVRHERLFDYARSSIVDEGRPRSENLGRLRTMDAFFRDGTRLLRGDRRFWLIELAPAAPRTDTPPAERDRLHG